MEDARIKVDIWGSCVARDSMKLGGQDESISVRNYFQLGSFPLQFTDHILENMGPQDFSYAAGYAPRRWLKTTWNHEIVPTLDSSGSDWLILDSRPYAYGTMGIPLGDGRYEYVNRNDLQKMLPALQRKGILDSIDDAVAIPDDDPAVEEGLKRFAAWCRERYGPRIILIEFFESGWSFDRGGATVWNERKWDNRRHLICREAYFNREFHSMTGCYVVRSPVNVTADVFHKWGNAPVHYAQEFYEHAYKSVMAITRQGATREEIESELLCIYLDSYLKITETMSGHRLSKMNATCRAKEYILNGQAEKAWDVLKKLASDCGDARFDIIADFFREGSGACVNPKAAVPLLDAANETGRVDYHQIFKLIDRYGTEEECARMVHTVLPLAEQGQKDAIICLSLAHSEGRGTNKDYPKSKSMLQGLIDSGYDPARTVLFDVIWEFGTEEDYGQMVESIRPLIKKNDTEAIRRMVNAYDSGRGVKKDYKKAVELLAVPLDKGASWAPNKLFDLAWKFKREEDYAKAVEAVRPLAESGNGYAMGRLARAYRYGRGVEKDLDEARRWYAGASKKGIAWARKELGEIDSESASTPDA